MMIGCAASTGLPWCDERVRVTAATSDERPGQGCGDPGTTPPDHGPRAAAGHNPAAVPPQRPGVPGRPATPPPTGRARPVPAAGPARDGAALAPGPPGAPPRGQVPSQAAGSATDRPLHPPASAAPGTREPVLGLPAHPRRTARPRDKDRRLHRAGDPAAGRDRPGTRAHVYHLGQLPPLPGRDPARLRLLRDRHLNRRTSICWRSSSTPPGGSGSSARPLIPLRPGSPRLRGTSSWISRTPGAGRFLIRDRDGKFPSLFDTVLNDAGIEVVLSGVQMPRMNSIMERWVQTCRPGPTCPAIACPPGLAEQGPRPS